MYAERKCAYDGPSQPKTFRFEGNAAGLKLSVEADNSKAKYLEIRSRELRIDAPRSLISQSETIS